MSGMSGFYYTHALPYRVSHVLVHLGWVDFDSCVPPSCPAAQPLLLNSHQPKQSQADTGTLKKSPQNPVSAHLGRPVGLYRLKEKLCIRSATFHHLQRFFLQVRVGVPRSVADEGDDDEVDAVEHQLPHHEVHLDFLHAAVLELLAEFLAEVAPGSNCIKIGNPEKLSIREKVLGKSYSLENSLRESIFREDLFLYNSSLASCLCK